MLHHTQVPLYGRAEQDRLTMCVSTDNQCSFLFSFYPIIKNYKPSQTAPSESGREEISMDDDDCDDADDRECGPSLVSRVLCRPRSPHLESHPPTET
jgi:hypothetical protein